MVLGTELKVMATFKVVLGYSVNIVVELGNYYDTEKEWETPCIPGRMKREGGGKGKCKVVLKQLSYESSCICLE